MFHSEIILDSHIPEVPCALTYYYPMVTSPVTEVPHQSITGTDCGSVTDLTSQSSRACTHVCVGGGSVPFDPPHVGTAHVGSCHHHNTDRPRHQTRPWGCPFPVTPCPLATMTVLHLRDFALSGMLCKWDHTTCDLLQYAFSVIPIHLVQTPRSVRGAQTPSWDCARPEDSTPVLGDASLMLPVRGWEVTVCLLIF